jgi:hypothetical protein
MDDACLFSTYLHHTGKAGRLAYPELPHIPA